VPNPIVEHKRIHDILGVTSGGGTTVSGIVTNHGELDGLLDDDHTQYLLVTGSRAMTGDLDMGASAVTNVGNVDGVDVSTLSSNYTSHAADTDIHFTEASIDHNSILNTHNLTTDIDHALITNTHNLTTDISHLSIQNVGSNTHTQIDSHILIAVTKVDTPVDDQVAVWTGNGTLEGDANLTWDSNQLYVNNAASANWPILAEFSSSLTSVYRSVLSVRHVTDGNMVDGFGAGVVFSIKDPGAVQSIAAIAGIRDGADGQGALIFETDSGSMFVEAMRIDSSQRVGIGTETLGNRLTVRDSSTSCRLEYAASYTNTARSPLNIVHETDAVMVDGFGVAISFTLKDGSGGNTIATVEGQRNGADDQGKLVFRTNDGSDLQDYMVLDYEGNVGIGIGTASPGGKLEVANVSTCATRVSAYGTGANDYSALDLRRSRGTSVGTLTATADEDILASINFRGVRSSGPNWDEGARIRCIQNGSAVDSVSADLVFSTGNTTGLFEAMRIDFNQDVQFANGIRVGSTSSTTAGDIQWDGSNFQGHDGVDWVDLDVQAAGGVDTSGSPADNQIAVFTDGDTIEGDSTFTWDGVTLTTSGIQLAGTTRLTAPADGDLIINNAASGQGIRLDTSTTNARLIVLDEDGYTASVQGSAFYCGSTAYISDAAVKFSAAMNASIYQSHTYWGLNIYSSNHSFTGDSGSLHLWTGDQTNVGNYDSGSITLETGATTNTIGDSGSIILKTGVAVVGAADAGDIIFQTHGTVEQLRIDASDSTVQLGGLTRLSAPADGALKIWNAAGTYSFRLLVGSSFLTFQDAGGALGNVKANSWATSIDSAYFAANRLSLYASLGRMNNYYIGGDTEFFTADASTAIDSGSLDFYTGDQTNAGDYASGAITLVTGATTDTDGNTGDITLRTGAAVVGVADAGGIYFQTHGTNTRLAITPTGFLELEELATEATGITAGYGALYAKTDGALYYKPHDGAEIDLTASGLSGTGVDATDGEDDRIAVFTGSDSIEGDTNFTWDGSTLAITGAITVTGNVDGVDVSAHGSRHHDGGADEIEADDLAATAIADGYLLTAVGDGTCAWETSVAIDAAETPAQNEIAVFSDSNTVSGDSNLTWDGLDLALGASNKISIGPITYFTSTALRLYSDSNVDFYNAGRGTLDLRTNDVSPAYSSGMITIRTGDSENAGDYDSGELRLWTGNSDTVGETGDVSIRTGEADAGSSSTGSILLQTHGDNTRMAVLGDGDIEISNDLSNSQTLNIKSVSTVLSSLDGASDTTTGIFIPAGAVVVAVSTRVTSSIEGADSYSIAPLTGFGNEDWGSEISGALGTTSDNTDWTNSTIQNFAAGDEVRLTAIGGDPGFDDGAVRITVHYLDCTAAAS